MANPSPCVSAPFHSAAAHISAFPLRLSEVRCVSHALRIISFAVLCYADAFLCLSPPPQFTARLFLCNAPLRSAYAMLRSSMQCCSLAFQFYATAMHDLSMLHFSTAFQCCSEQLHSKSVSCFSPPFHRRATHGLAITRRVFPVRRISIACVRFFRRKFQRFSCRN